VTRPIRGFVEKLFPEHRRALQGYFYGRIRAKSDASDLAADVQQWLGELPSLDSEVEGGQMVERLGAVVEQLPARWRTALILQNRYGLTRQQNRRATRSVVQYGEEISGAGSGPVPAGHGAMGMSP